MTSFSRAGGCVTRSASATTFFLTLLLSGCGGGDSAKSVTMTTPAVGLVTVSGGKILRDGKPWTPHGFMQIAFVDPPAYTAALGAAPVFVTAAQNYSSTEYAQMVQAGADSVRIQVAQTGDDPSGLYYSATFVQNVLNAVAAARAAGLTVILSDQDESQTGETNELPLPGAGAQRAWMNLLQTNPKLGQDAGVLLEIYNEPFISPGIGVEGPPSSADWSSWSTAMNAVVSTIRATGSTNVLVADGLAHAEELSGAPALADPLNSVVYGSHPYAHNYEDQSATGIDTNGNVVAGHGWNVMFGSFAATHPVIVTEWGNGYYCDNFTGISDVAFLQYIQNLNVGLMAGTWDWAGPNFGMVREDFPNSITTSFPSIGTNLCDAGGNIQNGIGPGKLVQTWYSTGTPSLVLE